MRNIENDLRCRRRNPIGPSKTTREGPLTNRYRVILTFFIIGCLTAFLIGGIREVYGAEGISYSPSPVDFGDRGVGGSYTASFKITNTARKGDLLQIVDIPKWAPPERPWLTLESTTCIESGNPITLDRNESCLVTYSFHPYYVGEYSTPVNIRYSFYPYNTVNNLNVQMVGTGIKGTPTITWNNPADITYGTALSSTQLNAKALNASGIEVPGSYVYTPAVGTVLNAGNNQSLSVTFTPTDTVNYNTATKTVYINVLKATPTVSVWPTTPSAGITYGQALWELPLTGGTASVPGTFAFTNPTTVPPADSTSAQVTFTPNDSSNYYPVPGSVAIVVARATPTITWVNPADIVYGTALNGTQLNATANVAGTFAYTPAAGTKLNAGLGQTLSVTFTPSDTTNYNTATKTVKIDVLQATPIITWSNPADIVYGTALNGKQLNATANVDGSFTYTPASGAVLNAGSGQNLNADFYPTDAINYKSASKTVQINVLQATVTITWAPPADITHPTPLTEIQLNATATPTVQGTFVYTPDACIELPVGNDQVLSVTFDAGPNYETASATVTINVLAPIVTKEQVYDKWICTQRDVASGFPLAMYQCENQDGSEPECSDCITAGNRCGNLSPSDLAFTFSAGNLRWVGPTNETVDFVTVNPSVIFRCVEGTDCCFSCKSGLPWSCRTPNLVNTPTVITRTLLKIGDVWACGELPDSSGCLTKVYSCSNATDQNPCPCGNDFDYPEGPRLRWTPSTFQDVSFDPGQLKWVGPGSDDPSCQIVYFVTSKIVGSVPMSCIYKCITDTGNCFSYCSPLE